MPGGSQESVEIPQVICETHFAITFPVVTFQQKVGVEVHASDAQTPK